MTVTTSTDTTYGVERIRAMHDADAAPSSTEQREAEAMRLAWTLPPREVSRALDEIERMIRRRMGESVHADGARADATSRALVSMSNGIATGPAVGAACRDAIADATRRAATVALVSLDAPVGDDGATLADAIDSGATVTLAEHGRARLSAMGQSTGGYRGVSRVPVPTDCLAAPLVSPVMLAELTRAAIEPDALATLDATLTANVAAEAQRLAHVDALAAYVAQAKADALAARHASRGAQVTLASKAASATARTLTDARRESRTNVNPHRPRTSEVCEILGASTSGPSRQRIAAQQSGAWTAYQTHRAALVAATLAAWTASLDAQAAHQRRNAHAAACVLTGRQLDTETPAQTVARIASERTATRAHRRALDAPRRRHNAHTAHVGAPVAHLDAAAKTRQHGPDDRPHARNGAGWNKGSQISRKGSTWAEPRTVDADAVTARPRTVDHDSAPAPDWTPRRPGSTDADAIGRHHCHADNEGIPATEGTTHRPPSEHVATFDAIAAACGMSDQFAPVTPGADWTAPSADANPLPRLTVAAYLARLDADAATRAALHTA